MLIIEKIDTSDKKQVQRFVDLPFRLYAGHQQWVPPIRSDIALIRQLGAYGQCAAERYLGTADPDVVVAEIRIGQAEAKRKQRCIACIEVKCRHS